MKWHKINVKIQYNISMTRFAIIRVLYNFGLKFNFKEIVIIELNEWLNKLIDYKIIH